MLTVAAPKDNPTVAAVPKEPALKQENPEPEPPAVVVKKPEGNFGLKKLGRDLIENEQKCEQHGTKINFVSLPTLGFEKANADPNKLVMILHIAGNFEERGLT